MAAGIRDVIGGGLDEFFFDYPCHSADGPHGYYMRATRRSGEGPLRGWFASHEEITALKLSEEALRQNEVRLTQQKVELESKKDKGRVDIISPMIPKLAHGKQKLSAGHRRKDHQGIPGGQRGVEIGGPAVSKQGQIRLVLRRDARYRQYGLNCGTRRHFKAPVGR